jgi:hypothetical protein
MIRAPRMNGVTQRGRQRQEVRLWFALHLVTAAIFTSFRAVQNALPPRLSMASNPLFRSLHGNASKHKFAPQKRPRKTTLTENVR